jgi:hypothetical protein
MGEIGDSRGMPENDRRARMGVGAQRNYDLLGGIRLLVNIGGEIKLAVNSVAEQVRRYTTTPWAASCAACTRKQSNPRKSDASQARRDMVG